MLGWLDQPTFCGLRAGVLLSVGNDYKNTISLRRICLIVSFISCHLFCRFLVGILFWILILSRNLRFSSMLGSLGFS